MLTFHLTFSQAYALTNALRVAEEQYRRDADSLASSGQSSRLIRQFRDQAKDTKTLAKVIEAAMESNGTLGG